MTKYRRRVTKCQDHPAAPAINPEAPLECMDLCIASGKVPWSFRERPCNITASKVRNADFMRLPFRISRVRLLLFGAALLIQMISAFPTIGLPLLRDQVSMSYSEVGLLFSVAAVSSMILEPVVNILSDLTHSKKYWVIGAMIVLSGAFLMAGLARSYAVLLLSFAMLYPAQDIADSAIQTALIDDEPGKSTRTLIRLAYFGNMGDFLAPVTVAVIAFFALGWSTLCLLAAVIWLGVVRLMLFQPFPVVTRAEEKDERSRVLAGLRIAARNPALFCWVVMAIFPIMLDEVFRSFAGLYLKDTLQMETDEVEVLLAIETGSGFAGLLITEVLLSRGAPVRWMLFWSAAVAFVSMVGLLLTRQWEVAVVMLCLAGASSIAWFPLARAEVYHRLPGYSGTGRALLSLGAPVNAILPSAVGFIAGAYGIEAGLGFLTLAPLGILVLTLSGLAQTHGPQTVLQASPEAAEKTV
jgi:fucose permease